MTVEHWLIVHALFLAGLIWAASRKLTKIEDGLNEVRRALSLDRSKTLADRVTALEVKVEQ